MEGREMKPFGLSACALALGAIASLAPDLAAARTHHHWRHYHRHYASNGCAAARHRHAVNGTIIGAIGGGLVANGLARGDRGPGTLLGAGVGALAGHEIGKNSGC
jgi:hypothetical protein